MKDRFLNILLITFVFLLALNLFLPKPAPLEQITEPHFTLSKKSTVVPNYPVLTFKNTKTESVSFNTCSDLQVLSDLKTVVIDDSAKGFCKTIEVAPQSEATIDLTPLAPLFTQPRNIGFKLNFAGQEITANVLVEERGFFRTLLATLFYAPILNLFVFLLQYMPNHSLGLAIIGITIIVRIILLVPQHQMLVSSRRLQEIQPKIRALQAKHKGDQAKMGMELMELYKKEKVNPLGACLPLAIQMPILLVLYWVLISIQDQSNHFYFYGFLQGFDVSTIETWFLGMNLLSIGGLVWVVLWITVASAQWLQIKLSQVSQKGKTPVPVDPNSFMPDPEMMNKFMLWGMPLIIGVSTIFFPVGVGIYWLIGTLFMLVQQVVANRASDMKKKKGEIIIKEKVASES